MCRDLYRNSRNDVHLQQLLLTGGDISTRQAMDGRSVWEEPPPPWHAGWLDLAVDLPSEAPQFHTHSGRRWLVTPAVSFVGGRNVAQVGRHCDYKCA